VLAAYETTTPFLFVANLAGS